MRIIILSIVLYISIVSYAQNDTIYLNDNYLERNGHKYNRIENDMKTGKWIEYTIEDNILNIRLASGIDAHWHDNIYTEYRPLNQGEYCGIEILTSEKVIGEIDGDTIYGGNYIKVVNKIPPGIYKISGHGKYRNNKKEGKWSYFHLNQRFKKEIKYKKGLPQKGFIIYRPVGTIMFEVIKINAADWEIIKYSESGEEKERTIKKMNEFKALF